MCQKKEKRDIFNLAKMYNCENCNNFKKDYIVIIGNNPIFIYYLFNGCKNDEIANWRFLVNFKLQRLLYDYIHKQRKTILLWLEEDEGLDKYASSFDCLLEMACEIHVIYK